MRETASSILSKLIAVYHVEAERFHIVKALAVAGKLSALDTLKIEYEYIKSS